MSTQNHLDKWAGALPKERSFYMAVLDDQERMSFVNALFFRTFRRAKARPGKTAFAALIHPADLKRVKDTIASCRRQLIPLTVAARVKNSPYQWIKWQISPFPGSYDGRLLCLGVDIYGEELQSLPEDAGGQAAEAIIQAQQEERARLGHELHDNVNQILVSAQLFLDQLQPDNDEFRLVKSKTAEILALAVEEIRHLSRDMVLPDFSEKGLIGSIRQLVGDLQYCKPFAIRFLHNHRKAIEALDQHRKVMLYRIVQEQIKNIIKYAQAKHVVIDLHCEGNLARLEIADDGRGFDPAATRHGLGLSNIQERVRLYNGEVTIDSAPGRGCTLIVSIPPD